MLYDIAALPSGRLLATGAAGYTQNPTGASISEAASPLLVQLTGDGVLIKRIPLAAAPRHNQLRTALEWHGGWLLGNMDDGPDTHSADGDTALLRADGQLREERQLDL